MKEYETVKCWRCDGYGIADTFYHTPEECSNCNGSGHVIFYPNSGTFAKYPGGPLLGRKGRNAQTLNKEDQ